MDQVWDPVLDVVLGPVHGANHYEEQRLPMSLFFWTSCMFLTMHFQHESLCHIDYVC